MRGDEQAAAFGPQTLKQREDAGVRSALGEGAAKIEVTECGHMPGDFRFVGVRADFTENTFQRRADEDVYKSQPQGDEEAGRLRIRFKLKKNA